MITVRSYNPSSRYRQRISQRWVGVLFFLALFVVCAFLGFWGGQQFAAARLISQGHEISTLKDEVSTLRTQLTEAQAETKVAQQRYTDLEAQLLSELPQDGPLRELMQLVRGQLVDGIDAERLRFVIRSARPPQNCSDPDAKRFVVSTPAYRGQDSQVSIDNGVITIKAEGASARNPGGNAEAWFDPAQAVTVKFAITGGATEEKKAVLPISHTVVARGKEYRFNLSEGPKSFIKITYDSCDYP